MKNLYIIFAIILLLLLTILAVVLLTKKKKEKYKKCICSSREGRTRNCQDTEVVDKLYTNNVITESTDLPSKGWSTISPGDYSFPHSTGCNWNDGPDADVWRSWDFTDF